MNIFKSDKLILFIKKNNINQAEEEIKILYINIQLKIQRGLLTLLIQTIIKC